MIFADKLIALRKKAGYSEEELVPRGTGRETERDPAVGLQMGGCTVGAGY